MAVDPKKRQKQLAKKAAKRKEVRAVQKASQDVGGRWAQLKQLTVAGAAPIYECLAPEGLFTLGVGSVVFARSMPSQVLAVSIFLVDVHCLGVKDVAFAVLPPSEYEHKLGWIRQNENLQSIDPSCARKLIEAAAAYAADLGFPPHKDYRTARLIFGDIDPEACPTEYEFGKDGKPFYVSGPHDSEAKSRKIVDTLMAKCGPDGFRYLIGLQE